MTKRTFFKSLMGVVATVALAPEIAFGAKLEMPNGKWRANPEWHNAKYEAWISSYYMGNLQWLNFDVDNRVWTTKPA